MVKKKLLILSRLALLLVTSCALMPAKAETYNPDNQPNDELVTLNVGENVIVSQINNTQGYWAGSERDGQIIRIPSGTHSFTVSFDNGRLYTKDPVTITGRFEKGNSYLIKHNMHVTLFGQSASFHIYRYNENVESEEVTVEKPGLRVTDLDALLGYTKYVLNPTGDNIGNTVRLENERYKLLFRPDMAYSLTDKEDGTVSHGRAGFIINPSFTNGKVYLLEVDLSEMSSRQFLEGNYNEVAEIVMRILECSESEVTYEYEKPADLAGNKVTFSITEEK